MVTVPAPGASLTRAPRVSPSPEPSGARRKIEPAAKCTLAPSGMVRLLIAFATPNCSRLPAARYTSPAKSLAAPPGRSNATRRPATKGLVIVILPVPVTRPAKAVRSSEPA